MEAKIYIGIISLFQLGETSIILASGKKIELSVIMKGLESSSSQMDQNMKGKLNMDFLMERGD